MPRINPRVLAEFAIYAVHFQLVDPANVIAWADEMISEERIPPPWLLDLSLVDRSDRRAVHDALTNVPGNRDPKESIRLLNGLVLREWRRGFLTITQVPGIGWTLYEDNSDCRDVTHWGAVVAECLADGHVSDGEMRETIDRELAPFQKYIEQLPAWA